MNKSKTKQNFLQLTAISTTSFLATGIAIALLTPVPEITLIVDRSYCPADRWQQVTEKYQQLYQKHQYKNIKLQQTILINEWNKEKLKRPLKPTELAELATYGSLNIDLQQILQKTYPQAVILNCQNNTVSFQ